MATKWRVIVSARALPDVQAVGQMARVVDDASGSGGGAATAVAGSGSLAAPDSVDRVQRGETQIRSHDERVRLSRSSSSAAAAATSSMSGRIT